MQTFSNQLLKIASYVRTSAMDEKLFGTKTKQSAINYIYKKVNHLITGFFHDEDWHNIKKLFDAIKELGVDLDWGVKDGGYHDVKDNTGNITSKYKQYDLEISFTNSANKQIKIKGQLIATAAGDQDNPFGRYDLALILN